MNMLIYTSQARHGVTGSMQDLLLEGHRFESLCRQTMSQCTSDIKEFKDAFGQPDLLLGLA